MKLRLLPTWQKWLLIFTSVLTVSTLIGLAWRQWGVPLSRAEARRAVIFQPAKAQTWAIQHLQKFPGDREAAEILVDASWSLPIDHQSLSSAAAAPNLPPMLQKLLFHEILHEAVIDPAPTLEKLPNGDIALARLAALRGDWRAAERCLERLEENPRRMEIMICRIARGGFPGDLPQEALAVAMRQELDALAAALTQQLEFCQNTEQRQALLRAVDSHVSQTRLSSKERPDPLLMAMPLARKEWRDLAPSNLLAAWHQAHREPLAAGYYVSISELENLHPFILVLALLCGFGWLALLLRLGRIWEWESLGQRRLVPLFALLLGGLSASLTLVAVVATDLYLPLQSQVDLNSSSPLRNHAESLIYFILGVGLREEGLKLICFLPLAFWLRRVRDQRIIIVAASLVGLGFAIMENHQYALSGAVLSGRFLTATALHMALTGLCGLALHQSFRCGGDLGPRTFVIAFIVHGLYDFLLSYPGLEIFAMTLFCLVISHWLKTIHECGGGGYARISATSIFLASLALALGCDLSLSLQMVPLLPAIFMSMMSLLGSVILAILFLREFRDGFR